MLCLVEKKTGFLCVCVFAFDRATTSACVEWLHALTAATSSSLEASSETGEPWKSTASWAFQEHISRFLVKIQFNMWPCSNAVHTVGLNVFEPSVHL